MKASIIIPAYNASKTIDKCLEAVISQKYKDFEVILVDDGSTDDTYKIAKRYPVKIISQENKGRSIARNNGAQHAKGKIIIFLDSDCVPIDDYWLINLTKPFLDLKIGATMGVYYYTNKKKKAAFWRYWLINYMFRNLTYIDFAWSYSLAIRKSIFNKINGFDQFYIESEEDINLSYKIIREGYKIMLIRDARVYHHEVESFLNQLKKQIMHAKWRVPLIIENKKFKDSHFRLEYYLRVIIHLLLIISILFIPFSMIPFLFFFFLSFLLYVYPTLWIVSKTKNLSDVYIFFFQFLITFMWIIGAIEGIFLILKRKFISKL